MRFKGTRDYIFETMYRLTFTIKDLDHEPKVCLQRFFFLFLPNGSFSPGYVQDDLAQLSKPSGLSKNIYKYGCAE